MGVIHSNQVDIIKFEYIMIIVVYIQNQKKEQKMAEEKKSLFDKAIDALTDRDEKAAEEKARLEAAAAKEAAGRKAMADKAAADKAAADKAAAEKAAALKAATAKAADERADAVRDAMNKAAAQKAAAPKKGVVTVRSLRVRADHNTTSEVVAGLVDGNEVTILDTWTDGKDTWAKLENGWAAMVYDGETYIKPA
jgi:hypothetical protein